MNFIANPEPKPISRAPLEVVYGESPKERTKPPHHLLETQIFPNLHKNDIFQVEPEQLSFIIQPVSIFKGFLAPSFWKFFQKFTFPTNIENKLRKRYTY